MAKLVIVVPNTMMAEQAENAARGMDVDASVLKEHSDTVVAAVREQQQHGALVAIARGNHAHLLKRETSLPVIEIVLSGQNIALLLSQARSLSGKPHPKIAIIGFENMFSDIATLARILDVEAVPVFVKGSEEIGDAVRKAHSINADVVIGGEIAMEYAAQMGIPHLFLHSTQDSVETAVAMAKRVLYAIELEKHRAAEFSSLVNYSFDAVLKLDVNGAVVVANYMAEKIFRCAADALRGSKISELIDLSSAEHPINETLRSHRSSFASIVQAENQALIANFAPITVDGETTGYILSLQEFKKIEELEEKIRKERYSKDHVANATFEEFRSVSAAMIRIKETAIQYAKYDLPVLLVGEVGVGKRALAECIHNGSLRRKNPFVVVDCGGLSSDMQQRQFMGVGEGRGEPPIKGAFSTAHTGTLLIEHIDRMDEFCQYQLLHILRNGCIVRLDGKIVLPVNVRILCTTEKNLYQCMREGQFLEPLYCVLTQLELNVPSLRDRAEDMPDLLDMFMEKYSTLYHKFVRLSAEARELIYYQTWGGNVLQLQLFCEKIILLATDKFISADFVREHLPSSFIAAEASAPRAAHRPMIVESPEEADLLRALEEHHGNRTKAAVDLKISKTTLWRRMKKYGVEQTYR